MKYLRVLKCLGNVASRERTTGVSGRRLFQVINHNGCANGTHVAAKDKAKNLTVVAVARQTATPLIQTIHGHISYHIF
jgi:hypothetical protein